MTRICGIFFPTRTGLWIAVYACLQATLFVRAQDAPAPITSVAAVRALSQMQLLEYRPVRLEGVVLAVFPDGNWFFLYQNGLGLVVNKPVPRRDIVFGSRVLVQGTTTLERRSHVAATDVEVVSESAVVPTGTRLTVAEALAREPYGDWLEVSGFVQSVRRSRLGMQIWLRHGGQRIQVMAPREADTDLSRLMFARATVRCVLVAIGTSGSPAEGRRVLWVSRVSDVSVDEAWRGDAFAIPATTVAGLLTTNPPTGADTPVRLRARLKAVDEEARELVVADDTGEIALARAWGRLVETNDVLEVLGFREVTDDKVRLDVAELRWLGRSSTDRSGSDVAFEELQPVVGTMSEVRSLPVESWSRELPVRVIGTVSFRDEGARMFQLQQSVWSGVMVRLAGTNAIPAVGQQALVKGHTSEDGGRLMIQAGGVRSMGERELPRPQRGVAGGFAAGQLTGAWLGVDGVVRSAEVVDGYAHLRVQWLYEVIRARVAVNKMDDPGDWVDAVVDIRGTPDTVEGHVPGERLPVLLVSDAGEVEVVEPAPEDPFAVEIYPLADIISRRWVGQLVRRVRVRGVVTAARAEHLVIDDGTNAVPVRLTGAEKFRVGEEIEVAGFPDSGENGARLEDAIARFVVAGRLPAAMKLPAKTVLRGTANHRRVRVRGALIGQAPDGDGHTLMLQQAGQVFSATLPVAAQEAWQDGSELEVIGVCQFQGVQGGAPRSFQVLLADAGDVSVLRQPPWWNTERTIAAVGGMALLAMMALGWAFLLRRNAEQSRRQFLTTFEASPLPAWIVNRRTQRLVAVNHEFIRLFGYTREEAVGRSVDDFNVWDSEAKRRRFVAHLDDHERVSAYEARLRSRAGQKLQVLLAAEPMQVGDDACRLIIAYDITERLKLIEQLRQSQKMEAIGQLAAGVAHDFNNLLTVIRGNTELLLMQRDLDAETRVLNQEVEQAAARAADLTRQLLAFSRRQVMRRRSLELRQIVTSAGGMLGRLLGESVEVVCRPGGEPLPVQADSGMLDQVILNLAVNGRDAMPDGGTLVLTTHRVSYTAANLPANPDAFPGDFAVLSVTDTGAGMSEDVRRHAFEPFYTTKDVGKGTGLGLSTVYGIVSQHGGWIQLDSETGKGTTFAVHLPMASGKPDSDSEELTSPDAGSGSETLLVVEDDETVRGMVSRILTPLGYRMLTAVDAPDAESQWREHGGKIDLVLTDILMPNGLSGLELAARLRLERPDLKVIYMTAYTEELVEHGGGLRAGHDFLAKPFERWELIRLVRKRLDEDAMTSIAS